tara:strand:- start:636 stop:848 length:213 start_codon:yes stop_codon:yes gene_type:complete
MSDYKKYPKEVQDLFDKSYIIAKIMFQELVTQYETAQEDWNTTARHEIGLRLFEVGNALIGLENLMMEEE